MSSYDAVEIRMKRRMPRGREYFGRRLREVRVEEGEEEEEEEGRRRKRRRRGEEEGEEVDVDVEGGGLVE
jgi:hypothetical protein